MLDVVKRERREWMCKIPINCTQTAEAHPITQLTRLFLFCCCDMWGWSLWWANALTRKTYMLKAHADFFTTLLHVWCFLARYFAPAEKSCMLSLLMMMILLLCYFYIRLLWTFFWCTQYSAQRIFSLSVPAGLVHHHIIDSYNCSHANRKSNVIINIIQLEVKNPVCCYYAAMLLVLLTQLSQWVVWFVRLRELG